MFGIGMFEILLIAVICLIALGPKQLPMVMKKVAGFYRQLMDLKKELQFQVLSADDCHHNDQEEKSLENE